jgi:hypothetical protein
MDVAVHICPDITDPVLGMYVCGNSCAFGKIGIGL